VAAESWSTVGDGKHGAIFVSALSRPDRDEDWLGLQRRGMRPEDFRREYPSSAAEALEAAGERYFRASDVDATDEECEPLQERAGTFIDYRAGRRSAGTRWGSISRSARTPRSSR
jgi:hypothetical protein